MRSSSATTTGYSATGAPFNVYAPGFYAHPDQPGQFEAARTWAYGVKAGDTITDSWPLNQFQDAHYHLRVYGPNGFFREYKGNAAGDPPVDIQFHYQSSPGAVYTLTGAGELHLANSGGGSVTIEVIDHAYGANHKAKTLAAGSDITLPLSFADSHGWYDFSVLVKGHQHFGKRYAGRIETGHDSISDPFMGRVV